MTYSEKLKDPRWQRVRLAVFERDDFTCVSCQSKDKTLHVHHRRYHREPWDADLSELDTVCEDCHENIETVIRMIRENPSMRFMPHICNRAYMLFEAKGEAACKAVLRQMIEQCED